MNVLYTCTWRTDSKNKRKKSSEAVLADKRRHNEASIPITKADNELISLCSRLISTLIKDQLIDPLQCEKACIPYLNESQNILQQKAALIGFPVRQDFPKDALILRLAVFKLFSEYLETKDQFWIREELKLYCFPTAKLLFEEKDRILLGKRKIFDIGR